MTAAENPYRVTAETISCTCGQSVSHGGAWNLVQRLGEKFSKEESHAVRQMEAGEVLGKEALPVLFEEMDGVRLSMQECGQDELPHAFAGRNADGIQKGIPGLFP